MNYFKGFRTAYRGLVANKLRSGLTMLGILIGVFAVVTMISIGSGATSYTTNRIQDLGSNLLMVTPGSSDGESHGPRQAQGTQTTLTYDDALAVKKEIDSVKAVSPEYSSQAQVVYKDENVNTSINSVTPAYQEVNNFNVLYGNFITEKDQDTSTRVAILGQNVASDLFNRENPIGKIIKIKNIPFLVTGVMEEKGQSGFTNQDDAIFIPLSTAQKRLFGVDHISIINISVEKEDQMDQVSSETTMLLINRHKLENEEEADFSIRNQAEILSTINQVTGVLTILLGGIAAVSLLVGGIGIMNIMLVSVTERTREIGLRKAVGAKKRDILAQFLIESVLLSLLGGVIGLLFGIVASFFIANIGGWPAIVSPNSIIIALLFSVGVGVFFGVYPARRASNLNPIEALRYE